MKRIQSRDNAQYKALLKLANSSRERHAQGIALLDGEHLIEAYRDAGGEVDTLFLNDTAHADAKLVELAESVPAQSRVLLSNRLFEEIGTVVTPTGIAALIHVPKDEIPPMIQQDCLMLDTIQDAGNLGSMLRTAAAAGVTQVFLSKGCAFAWSPKVLRAGMGAHFGLKLYERADLHLAMERFKGKIVATDLDAPQSLYEANLGGPVAWIFGNEGAGVSPDLAQRATVRVRIPMPGGSESLNVAAAAAVCLFEKVRRDASN